MHTALVSMCSLTSMLSSRVSTWATRSTRPDMSIHGRIPADAAGGVLWDSLKKMSMRDGCPVKQGDFLPNFANIASITA